MTDRTDDLANALPSETAESEGARLSAAVTTVPRDTLLTRGQAAEILDRSKSSIRRLEKSGELRPAAIGPNSARLFELEHVRQVERRVVRTRTASAAPEAYDGEMARQAFTLFDENVHPVDVTKRTGFDPRAVEALYQKWLRLRGGIFVPPEIAARIDVDLSFHPTPEKLLKCVESKRSRQRCVSCEERPPELCPECAKEMSIKEAKRRAAEARMRQELKEQERDHQEFMKMMENNLRREVR